MASKQSTPFSNPLQKQPWERAKVRQKAESDNLKDWQACVSNMLAGAHI